MTTYGVNLYSSKKLHDVYGTTPLDRAETYIEGAFGHINQHDVVVGNHSDYPLMYDDEPLPEDNNGFEYEQRPLDPQDDVSHPCLASIVDYNGIGWFFHDWLSCNGSPSGWDVHVLLTAGDSGGGHTIHWSDHSVCVVPDGNNIVDAPNSFTRYMPSDTTTTAANGLDAVQTMHHEMGHAFLHDDEEAHPDHNLGSITKTTTNHYWATPMGLNGDDSSECGSWNLGSYDVTGDRRWDMVWADCVVNRWESTLG